MLLLVGRGPTQNKPSKWFLRRQQWKQEAVFEIEKQEKRHAKFLSLHAEFVKEMETMKMPKYNERNDFERGVFETMREQFKEKYLGRLDEDRVKFEDWELDDLQSGDDTRYQWFNANCTNAVLEDGQLYNVPGVLFVAVVSVNEYVSSLLEKTLRGKELYENLFAA